MTWAVFGHLLLPSSTDSKYYPFQQRQKDKKITSQFVFKEKRIPQQQKISHQQKALQISQQKRKSIIKYMKIMEIDQYQIDLSPYSLDYIYMSHHTTPRSNFPQKQEILNNFDDNNDSLLDESNSFDLRNQIYELTSKNNNLEYQKNKISMSYENVLKEQKQKYAILERVCSEKAQKQEKLNYMVNELRSKCGYLSEENEALKKELHSVFEKNRITPNFNTIELAQEMDVLGDLLQKEERMQKLDRQLQEAKQSQYADLKEKIISLEKENKKLKEENMAFEAQKNDNGKTVAQQVEEYHKGLIKFKDATIEELKNEQINLTLQLDQARQTSNQKRSLKSEELAQLRQRQDEIAQLKQTVKYAQKQRTKVQTQVNRLMEANRRLEADKNNYQRVQKMHQQRLIQLTNQISEVRAAAFNDKIECKKQVNTIRLQNEEDKNKVRSIIQEKTQQNKRLQEVILTLNDQNQQLIDKQAANIKQVERIAEENRHLKIQIERYQRENSKLEAYAGQSNNRIEHSRENNDKIARLQYQLAMSKNQGKQKEARLRDLAEQLQKVTEQFHTNEELVQIMKIQKKQYDQKIKEGAKRQKQSEQSKAEKEKVITHLQSEIRTLKDDNGQLELANEQLKDKLETMRVINSDVQNIKDQLELEKKYYEQMRREEEELRKKHQRSESFKTNQQNSKQSKFQQLPLSERSMKVVNVNQSREKDAELNKEMESLRTQNYDLQMRLNQAENQINKKCIDINMKQQENIKLKEVLSNPRELNFEPIIENSKKTQFNAIFLENKIMLLEKDILGIKTIKEKQYEEYKKAYRKKIEQKYLGQLKKSSIYINELQKNVDLLNGRLNHECEVHKQLTIKMQHITKENYDVKCDYSEALEELNIILQKCKQLQNKHKQLQFDRSQFNKVADENTRLKAYLQNLSRNTQEKSLRLSNANDQIQKLNQTLMIKQSELKMLKIGSPNSSFVGSYRGEQKSNLLNVAVKQQMMQPSSDGDSLRSWIKKCPNYSRV